MNNMAEEEEEEENQNHTTKTTSTWGTGEELLLACAVKRHGFKNWDLVAMEVQARTCLPQILTTADVCEQKYHDLNRRFSTATSTATATPTAIVAAAAVKEAEEEDQEDEEKRKEGGNEKGGGSGGDSYFNNNNNNNNNEDVDDTNTLTTTTTTTTSSATTRSGGAGCGGDGERVANIPWLEELRKLRVAELKQEVHRYDVSILSLQLKVKRLEEEREKSVNLQDNKIQIQIQTKPPEQQRQQQQHQQQQQPDLNEDRSDNHKSDDRRFLLKPCISPEESDRENRSVNESNSTASEDKGGAVKLLEVDTVQAASVQQATPATEIGRDGSYDLDDSVTQLSSEAQSQSSASLGRKMRRRRRKERRNGRKEVGGGGGGGHGLKGKEVPVESEPLIGLLELIRAHKNGSLFENRLQTQETETYRNMVRQHMDIETLQTKLEQGFYTSDLSFHRDLLLLFNNAMVFFPESSVESLAAQELRSLVSQELRKEAVKSDAVLERPTSSIPTVITAELEGSDSLPAKHNSSVPIVVCRKRSSMSAKPSTSSSLGQKNEQQQQGKEDKAVCVQKPPVVEQVSLNMKSKEKPVTGVRSSRRSNKNFAKVTNTLGKTPGKRQSTSPRMKDGTVDKTEASKSERKKIVPSATDKKRSAANFLKRIKKNSPGEKLKKNNRGGEDGGGESNKDNSGKGDRGKETVLRKNSDRRQVKEESSPGRRTTAGPSKKVAEASKASSKRAREGGRKEAEDVVKRPRKRSRR